jgi:hypothetical protein
VGTNDYFVIAKLFIERDEWVLQVLTPAGEFRSGLLPKRWKRLSSAEQQAARFPGSTVLFSRYYLDIWGQLIQLGQVKRDGKRIAPAARTGTATKAADGWNLEIPNLGIVHIENSSEWDFERARAKASEFLPCAHFSQG